MSDYNNMQLFSFWICHKMFPLSSVSLATLICQLWGHDLMYLFVFNKVNVWDALRSLSRNTMCSLVVQEDKAVCLCVCNSLPSTSVGQLAILAFKP